MEAGWADPALRGVFYQSLNDSIKDHLCTQPETHTFEELVNAALRSDTRLKERHQERASHPRKSPLRPTQGTAQHSSPQLALEHPSGPPEEPMQMGHSKLLPEERQRRRAEGACFYCGKPGHLVNQCSASLNFTAPR